MCVPTKLFRQVGLAPTEAIGTNLLLFLVTINYAVKPNVLDITPSTVAP